MTSDKAKKILIVEDSPTQAEMLKFLLEKHDYSVSVASNGKEALALLDKTEPTIIISDIVMPEMDGFQLCRHIKTNEKLKKIPVILLTGLSDPADVLKGLECGADNFITKPYDEKYLLSRIQYMLVNRQLRERDRMQVGVEVTFAGQKYSITSERQQILDLLISTYEAAVWKNIALLNIQDDLRKLNEELERKVEERTVSLKTEMEVARQALDALRKSEEKYRRIVETTNEGIWMVDSELRTTFVNRRILDMLGYPADEMMGRKQDEFVAQEEIADHMEEIEKRRKGIASHYERRLRRKDNEIINCSVSATPLFDENKQFAGSFGMFTDITEHKRAEMEREQFYKFFQISTDIMVIADPNGAFMKVNPTTRNVLGYSEQELISKTFVDFVHPDDKQSTIDEMARQIKAGSSVNFENRYVCKDGTVRWLSWRATYNKDEGITYATARDITEQKRIKDELIRHHDHLEELVRERTAELEKRSVELSENQASLLNIVEDLNRTTTELQGANMRLKELDRMKSMFIASTSHELRTPLNSIIGFSSILLEGWSGSISGEQKEQIQLIHNSGQQLLSLINDVIDISKIEAGKIDIYSTEFRLKEVTDESVAVLKNNIKDKGLIISVEVPEIIMHTDKRRLRQCLLNYLSNAVKFTEKGSIGLTAKIFNNMIDISVTDTGIGIKEEELAKLFEPFVRLESPISPQVGGTGLGLYLTKKLVMEVLGGNVLVKSVYGKGSTFSMRIPVKLVAKT